MPILIVKLIHEKNIINPICVVDSGADFCTLPMESGKSLGIDFKKTAPKEILKKWLYLDKKDQKRVNELVEDAIKNKYAIPTSYECACGEITKAYYYPVTIEIEKRFKEDILVLWTPANSMSLLGRIGILDKIEELAFKKDKLFVIRFKKG